MIERSIGHQPERLLERTPVVVLTGPRQVGKTTLARESAREVDETGVLKLWNRGGFPESFPSGEGIKALNLQGMMEMVSEL